MKEAYQPLLESSEQYAFNSRNIKRIANCKLPLDFLARGINLTIIKIHMFKTCSFHGGKYSHHRNFCLTDLLWDGSSGLCLMRPCMHLYIQKLSLCTGIHLRKDMACFNICSRTSPEGRGGAFHDSPQLLNTTFVSITSCLGLLFSDSPTAADALGSLCIKSPLNFQ